MTGIFAKQPPAGRPRCARCHRPFTPKKEGDRYGPACARKLAALETLESVTKIAVAEVIG